MKRSEALKLYLDAKSDRDRRVMDAREDGVAGDTLERLKYDLDGRVRRAGEALAAAEPDDESAERIAALEAENADLRKGLGYLASGDWYKGLLPNSATKITRSVAAYWLRNAGKPESEHTHD